VRRDIRPFFVHKRFHPMIRLDFLDLTPRDGIFGDVADAFGGNRRDIVLRLEFQLRQDWIV
jgi:hypothetical protein